MKRLVPLVTALAGLSIALTACGSSGSSNTATSPAAPSGSTTASGSTTNCPSASASSSAGSSAAPSSPSAATATFPPGTGSIKVGSAAFPENELLADIYADAMTAKGVSVKKTLNIGERAAYLKALDDGSIDFIPEYSGSILPFLDPKATAKTSAEVAAALPAALGPKLVALNYAEAQDSDTITVTKETATKYNLKTIADLCPVAGQLIFGAPNQFQTRPDGIPALKSVYGVTFKQFTPLKAGGTATVEALKNKSIDAGDIFSTDSSIAANDFVTLEDPQFMFAAQNIVPIVTKSKVTQTIADAVNAVSAKLDTVTLAGLVAKVSSGTDADKVAKEWLSQNGLG